MKRYILLLFLVSVTTSLFSQNIDIKSIDSIFSEWNKPNVPGGAVGIIQDGELIYAKGYGLANLEYDIPNTPNSVFRIASTSKQFTAACIVLLAEQGKLSLEDKLTKFFPDFPDYAKDISVRHLLNHTSGIRDYLTISYFKGNGAYAYYKNKDIMKWLINQDELNFKPGDEYTYSNSGYWLLGQIVTKVAGVKMSNFAEKEIFKPLAMSSTHFHNDQSRIVKNRAIGYVPTDNGSYKIGGDSFCPEDIIGGAGIFTTINDIKKWDDAYYDNSVLSTEFWNIMTKSGILNNGDKIDYASGLFVWEYKGLKAISHGGDLPDFKTDLMRFPEQNFSIVVFANRGDAYPSNMACQVADLFLQEEFTDAEIVKQDNKENNNPEFILLDSAALESFVGYYWYDAESDNEVNPWSPFYYRTIYVRDDTLRYQRSETNESILLPISNNGFKMINVEDEVVVKFEENKYGNQIMSVTINNKQPITFYKYQDKIFTEKELNEFAGTYHSTELDINYELKIESGSIILYINENKISPLYFVYTDGNANSLNRSATQGKTLIHLFQTGDYGVFKFYTDGNGKIHEFRLADWWGRIKSIKFEKS